MSASRPGVIMGEPSEMSREAASRDVRLELAEAVVAARGAHEMVEELHAALVEERATTLELSAEVARLETELEALRATRLFRYTASLRAVHGSRRRSG